MINSLNDLKFSKNAAKFFRKARAGREFLSPNSSSLKALQSLNGPLPSRPARAVWDFAKRHGRFAQKRFAPRGAASRSCYPLPKICKILFGVFIQFRSNLFYQKFLTDCAAPQARHRIATARGQKISSPKPPPFLPARRIYFGTVLSKNVA